MTQIELIKTVASMNNETQNNFYENLKTNGISDTDINTIKSLAFYYKIYNDHYLYNTVVESMAKEMINH